jgi:O-antigen/teichoic acid export membrane protein
MLRDLLSIAGGHLVGRLLGFIAFAYLARVLAPSAYGAVEFAAALAAVFAILADSGVGAIGVRRLVRQPDALTRIAGEVLGARFVVAAAATLAMCAAGFWLVPNPLARALVILFGSSLILLPWNQSWLFQGTERMGAAAIVPTVKSVVFAAGVLALVRGSADAPTVGWVEIAATAGAALSALWMQRSHRAPAWPTLEWRRVVSLIRESLPLGLGGVVWTLNQYVPPLLVTSFVGLHYAAFFAAAHRLCVSLASLSWVYHFNLYPAIARRATGPRAELERLVRASFRLSAWTGIAVAAVLTVVSPVLLAAMFGAPFAAATPAFSVMVWMLPIILLSDHVKWVLLSSGAEHSVIRIQIPGALLMAASGVLLVPRIGNLGGAVAMVVAFVFVWCGLSLLSWRRLGWAPVAPAVTPAVVAAASLALARQVELPATLEGAAVAAAFGLLAPLLDRRLLPDLRYFARARVEAPEPSRPA